MALVALEAHNDKCTVTVAEHGSKVSKNLAVVDGLTLTCSVHGELASYMMQVYPKYSGAKRLAFAEGARHLGVDNPVWGLVDLAPQPRDY
jgi:hypothetical protein